MKNPIELKEFERKIFLQYFDDGFWDIYAGLLLLAFGLGILFEYAYFTICIAPMAIPVIKKAKSAVTFPRIGYIKFHSGKRKLVLMVSLGVALLGLFAALPFITGMDSSIYVILRSNMHIVFGAVWGGIFALGGAITDVKRFYAYGGLLFIALSISRSIGSLGINFTGVGAVIIFSDLIILLNFIRKYPLEESPGD